MTTPHPTDTQPLDTTSADVPMVLSLTAARDTLQRFANAHKLILEDKGECGFCRPCVGLISRANGYLDYNPRDASDYYRPIAGFVDDRLYPPESVPDAYHKHDCFAVLAREGDYDRALIQLALWIQHIESLGAVEVVAYETGATGLQAAIPGVTGYALRFIDAAEHS